MNSVSSLREKFDRKARENAERHHAESRRNKYKKRSASLEPPLFEEKNSSTEKSSKKEDQKEFRGRRSRRLSVESYFHVDKSPPRAHSLSPVPPSTSTRIEKRITKLPSPKDHSNEGGNSPPRQRAMALICISAPETSNIERNNNENMKIENSPKKSSSIDENIGSPAPKIRTEYDFLMTYKPDNENKVSIFLNKFIIYYLMFNI